MSNARLRLAFASGKANGNHVSSREGPLLLRAWGTSRFPTPLHAHGAMSPREHLQLPADLPSGRRRCGRPPARPSCAASCSTPRPGRSTSPSLPLDGQSSTCTRRPASPDGPLPTAGTRSPAPVGARRSRALSATMRASSPSSVRALPACPRSRSSSRSSSPAASTCRFPSLRTRDSSLGTPSGCPTFEFGGATLYKRITLVLEAGRVTKVFYPVFPPDRNAADVVAWLRARSGP